jgi:putative membrane-bound dehydrogenase-like protein
MRPLAASLSVFITGIGGFAASSIDAPKSSQHQLATFHFADENLTAELVAAEPDVVAPVAMAWDADGRLFVAEMTDYPSGPVSGRIRMLEDRDADGRYECATVFAEKIAYPNGVLPWNGGLLVSAAPDILFFKDSDGDGHADERRVLLTGFAEGNQQLRVNGLYWGLDNWVYGANGRSDGEVRWADDPTNRTVSIRRRDFRFRPHTKQFEAIAGHSQFGTAHDDWGIRFPVFNNIPIRHVVFEQRYLDRVPLLAGIETAAPISAPDDKGRVYYLAPPTLLIPQASDYFTSACGPTVYRGGALGREYRGNFFVCEPVHNLIQRRRLTPTGATFVAERTEVGEEFLASTDPWFHPVFLTTGPDGCLHVVDFYRKYVEHPAWVADELKTTVPWREGEEHGRIWRLRPKQWKPKRVKPNLTRARSEDLVNHLEHDNGWWRDTAQRLLVERQATSVVPALERMARRSTSALARLHALYTLDGLHGLSPDRLSIALKDRRPEIREAAIRLAEQFVGAANVPASSVASRSRKGNDADQKQRREPPAAKSELADGLSRPNRALQDALLGLLDDPSPRVRCQLGLTLGEIEGERKLLALSRLARTGSADHWQSLAILTSVGSHPWSIWKSVAGRDLAWFAEPNQEQAWFVEKLASLVAGSQDEAGLRESAASLGDDQLSFHGKMVLLAELQAAQKSNSLVEELLSSQELGQTADGIVAKAEPTALSPEGPLPTRLAAIRLLGRRPSRAIRNLVGLLLPENPPPVQSAALTALIEANDPVAAGFALDQWEGYTKSTRHQLIAAAARSSAIAHALLTALEREKVLLVEVDPATRQALQKNSNAELRQRAEQLFKDAVSPDREQVIQKFRPALQMAGDRRHGAEIFARTCLQCHAMQGEGNRVGPDLSGIAVQPRETMLMNILDPSRQVLPDFVSYTAITTESETLTGLITTESAASVTLRRPNVPDVTIQRSQIKQLTADGKSLMPDGLEQGLTLQDMADLLWFLRQPDAALLPKDSSAAAGKAGNSK